MKSKLQSYFFFSLYGGMYGVEGAFVGSIVFAVLWVFAPLFVLGIQDEMTQYVFSSTIVVIIPGLLFIGAITSLIPGVVGGTIIAALIHNDLIRNTNYNVIFAKGCFIGGLTGLVLWRILWAFNPLNPPLNIDQGLFIYYSITGVISASIGGVWTTRKLVKDGKAMLKKD